LITKGVVLLSYKNYLDNIKVEQNSICIIWLGQAGFLFKTSNNKIIVIDPYLTDYVYRLYSKEYGYGFKRLTASVFKPKEIDIDYLFSSHEHGDHLDGDAIYELMDNEKTMLFANKESMKIVNEAGVSPDKVHLLEKEMLINFDEFKVIVTRADHGEICIDALGFIFDFGFIRIYYSGDTCYNKEVLKEAIKSQPHIALLPINGAYGNLNAQDAAKLANDMKSKVCIPHHFWTFPLHKGEKGDPIDAMESFPKYAPLCKLVLLSPGEAFIYSEL
jgi:L-ascorbate 6-phosphate lactonase